MANINLNIKRGVFNEAYFPYVTDYSQRFNVYYGGAGSGKSIFVFQKLIIKAFKMRRKVLVVRKTAKSHANSTFQTVIDILSRFNVLTYCNINKTTLTILLPNGSKFLFYGCDDVEKIKSIAGITDIVAEECSELSLEEVLQLDLRLRANEPYLQFYFMFNPVSKANWTYKRWFDDGAAVDNDTFILHTTYKDNKFLPPEYIESLEKLIQTSPTYYKIYALGEFASLDKLVFNNWKVAAFNNAELKGALLVGLDFGFVNDTTALIASVLIEESKKIYIFQEWGETNKTNDEIAAVIKALGFSKSAIIADCADQKSIEEIKRCGVPRIKASRKGSDSILHGIQKLQQYQIIVHPSCEKTITELENYSWQKDKQSGEYINKPIDKFNHFIDALRYSLQCVNDGKLKTINKAVLGL